MIAALKDPIKGGVDVSIVGTFDDCMGELEAILDFYIKNYPVITIDLVNEMFEKYVESEEQKFENEKDNKHNT